MTISATVIVNVLYSLQLSRYEQYCQKKAKYNRDVIMAGKI